eukprot:TRINITY_DN19343_c0_g1_i1.p1 TRINITY_DN19343_c0_g1~~TRINITY_DN19343_c0_g1_i1.p1  ORF type:complete len:185 (+),score=27.66 TRINITY_DN19343_c0_g1_i1:240-794(+)
MLAVPYQSSKPTEDVGGKALSGVVLKDARGKRVRRAREINRNLRVKTSGGKLKSGVSIRPMKYQDALPLHNMWASYSQTTLQDMSGDNLNSRAVKLDLTGAKIKIEEARCDSQTGLTGICILESENTLTLVTEKDRTITIAKEGILFSFEACSKKFTLIGSHFTYKPGDRAGRKFKTKTALSLP